MQTPKARTGLSDMPRKVSPRASSLEVPPRISPQVLSSNGPQKVSPRVVRKLKTTAQDSDSTPSPNRALRTTKDNSTKAVDRKAPRGPVSEKNRPSRIVELESQISQLENDLEKMKYQLSSSEALRKRALQEMEELKKQPCSVDSSALSPGINEIKELKYQLEKVAESEIRQSKHAKLAREELHSLKEKLEKTVAILEDVKDRLKVYKETEAHAKALVAKALMQLETVKRTVETLGSDGAKSVEASDAIASDLEESRVRMNSLEELVYKFKAAEIHAVRNGSQASKSIEAELESEVDRLRSALEAVETRYKEEQTRCTAEIRTARELVEEIKSTSSQRQTELEKELKKSQNEIEELKAELMDKETELQGICEENEFLDLRLKSVLSGQRECVLEKEFEKSRADIENLKAYVIDKETELQNVLEENEMLRLEKNGETNCAREQNLACVKEAAAFDHETHTKVIRKATRIFEQLEAAREANSELEAELRRVKVQADQWRKAAEAAATMLSSENDGKYVGRTVSMDNIFSPKPGQVNLPSPKDMDDDLLKRKHMNILQKFGVLRKKTQVF